jgi:exodeoxyribonuclease VII small subunit
MPRKAGRAAGDKPKPPAVTFEKKMERLEEIVRLLEEGDKPLEESMSLFEEGVRLSNECRSVLEHTERKITLLLKGQEGEVPFDPTVETTESGFGMDVNKEDE